MQYKLDQVIVIQAKAFLFLVQVAIEDDIVRLCGFLVLPEQIIQRHGDHKLVIFRFLGDLAPFNHVTCPGKGHVAQCQAAFFVDDLEHRIDIRVVDDKETSGILHGMAVFLQH